MLKFKIKPLDNKHKIKKHFKSLKEPYSSQANLFWNFFRKKEKQMFIQLIKNLDKEKVLDLGAGACEYSEILLTNGAKKVLCVDFNPQIMSANQNPNIEKVIFDVEKFKTDDKYDLILCLGILEFLEKPKIFLQHLKTNLTSQGKIIVLLPLSFIRALAYKLFYLSKGIAISPLNLKKLNLFLVKNGFLLEETKPASWFSGFSIYSVKKL